MKILFDPDSIKAVRDKIVHRFYFDKARELQFSQRQSDVAQAAKLFKRANKWSMQSMIDFLSRYGVIPTYSFPVDCIRLEVLSRPLLTANLCRMNVRSAEPSSAAKLDG